jgi:ABC-2 type transport system ATP-binding protein
MVSPQPSRVIVEAVGLTKIFKDFWMRTKARAVDSVDFQIFANEIFGLLGPNGSGKSTIIKMILGLLHKTRGRLTVFGRQPSDVSVKKYIGFLPEESYLYRFLTARETLDYYGKLFGLDGRTRRRRTDELLEMVGLTQVAHRPIGEFSKGMTRRIGLAQALINDPDFLILDEPTAGLDPIGTRQVKDVLLALRRRGKTILLSSHLLADVEDVCDRMVMLYGGKIRAQGTAEELLADTDHTVIHTPRLRAETISRIEQLIESEEGKAIERVQAPRQRLEQLFLDIVEEARQEQVATSGAVHGGETAAFLRAEPSEGEALIESLLEEREPEVRARAVPMQPTAGAAERAQPLTDELLAELLHEDREEPKAEAVPPQPAAPPQAPQDVDRSVIDSLLSDEDESEEENRQSDGERP